MNDLSMAEYFLGAWAIGATLCAIYYQTRYKKAEHNFDGVAGLLCDVVVGDTKATKHGDTYKLESDDGNLKFSFRRNPNYKGSYKGGEES